MKRKLTGRLTSAKRKASRLPIQILFHPRRHQEGLVHRESSILTFSPHLSTLGSHDRGIDQPGRRVLLQNEGYWCQTSRRIRRSQNFQLLITKPSVSSRESQQEALLRSRSTGRRRGAVNSFAHLLHFVSRNIHWSFDPFTSLFPFQKTSSTNDILAKNSSIGGYGSIVFSSISSHPSFNLYRCGTHL